MRFLRPEVNFSSHPVIHSSHMLTYILLPSVISSEPIYALTQWYRLISLSGRHCLQCLNSVWGDSSLCCCCCCHPGQMPPNHKGWTTLLRSCVQIAYFGWSLIQILMEPSVRTLHVFLHFFGKLMDMHHKENYYRKLLFDSRVCCRHEHLSCPLMYCLASVTM